MKIWTLLDSIFNHKGMIYFILGVSLLYILQKLPFIKRWFVFLNTLQHELVHIGVAGCFGGIPVGMKINKYGGVSYTTKNNFIVRLAPYVVPLFSLLILVISMLLDRTYKPVAFGLAGLFYADFVTKTLSSLYLQTDILYTDRLIAYPFIFVSNVLVFAAMGYMVKWL